MGHPGIFEEVEVSKIDFAKNGLRVNIGIIEELAASIAEKGLLQPIVVRVEGDRYETVAGNRRLAACKLLKLRKVPCHIIELDDKESYEVSLVENVQHKTLNPIEEAAAFKKYVGEFGWGGVSHLALKIGKRQEYVTKRMQLLDLPEMVQEKIMHRRISPNIAYELLALDSRTAEKFAEMIENERLKRTQIRQVVKSIRHESLGVIEKHDYSPPTYDDVIGVIESALKKCVTILKSTLVRIDEVISEVDDDWITKEMLMQYRMIIHGDIDTFLRLRKKLEKKMSPTLIAGGEKIDYLQDDEAKDETSLHMHKGVWQ